MVDERSVGRFDILAVITAAMSPTRGTDVRYKSLEIMLRFGR